MLPYGLIIDEFLSPADFMALRNFADVAAFTSIENPQDGIVYPEVLAIQDEIGIAHKLSLIMGSHVRLRLTVLRRSRADIPAPQQAHDDVAIHSSMYSMILYMNMPEDCRGGTSLLRHIPTGIEVGANSGWEQDQNIPDKWESVVMAPMRTNRCFIFPSCLIHRSEPVGGFGYTPKDARLVLACLFDLGKE